MSQAEQVEAEVRTFLDGAGLPWELGGRPGELVVTLPGDQKLRTVCSLVVAEQSLSVSAFVVRNPDENHEAVYRYLLRRNLRLPGLAYAIDKAGDVYVTGRVPLAGVDAAYLDQVLGVILDAADGAFNELLALGFLESMKKEWAWRVSRGESTRNLDAFAHLLQPREPTPASVADDATGDDAPGDAATGDDATGDAAPGDGVLGDAAMDDDPAGRQPDPTSPGGTRRAAS